HPLWWAHPMTARQTVADERTRRVPDDETLPEYLPPPESGGPARSGGQPLGLVRQPTGLRHVLDGVPLHPGAVLELRVGSTWVSGAYRWTFDPGDDPMLVVDEMWGPHAVPIRTRDLLRWPR